MRTTVRLDPSLLRRAKRHALEHGTTLTALFDEALREKLARRPPERSAVPLPVFRGTGLRGGVDLHDGSALADLMEGAISRRSTEVAEADRTADSGGRQRRNRR